MEAINFNGYHKVKFVPKFKWMNIFNPTFTLVFYSGHRVYCYKKLTNEHLSDRVMSAVVVVKKPIGWTMVATPFTEVE